MTNEPEKQPESGMRTCPKCGAEMDASSPEQPCPACLMKLGLASWQSRGGVAEGGDADSLESTRDSRSRPFEPPSPEDLAGKLPNLEVLELLGHGGMGAVYKGRQTSLDRLVAIKLIRPDAAELPGFAERFTREARALAKLNHPNIVTIHDFGRTDDESPLFFLVMEYVEGTDLRRLIQGGDLAPEQALAIVPPICEALQFAHDAGIVHRDIKPENILLDASGRVKIADFGLARLTDGDASAFTLTGTRQVMGTLRYMAPEQMEASHDVDHRADIYSLGVVFYEMLTGHVPAGHFDPPSKEVQVDVRLDEVVLRSLAREPERRYQHASDVKTDLDAIAHDSGSGVRTTEITQRSLEAPPTCPHAIRGIGLLLLMVLFIGSTFAAMIYSHDPWLFFFLAMTAVCGIASSVFGFIAMSRIRRSSGNLGGLGLAFTAAVAFPTLIIDLAAFPLLDQLTRTDPALIGATILLLACNVPVLRYFWDGVKQSGLGGRATRQPRSFPWSEFLLEFVFLAGILALLGFAMHRSGEMNALLGLIVPWAIATGCSCYSDGSPATTLNFVITFLASAGLIAYGIVLEGGEATIAGLLATGSGFVAGALLGTALSSVKNSEPQAGPSEDESKSTSAPVADRGAMGLAWDAWWQNREPWLAKIAQAVLSIAFIACLIMYLSFQNTSTLKTAEDGTEYRHTTITYGSPDPWFRYDAYPEPTKPFAWEINYVSSSMGLMLLGFLLYCVSWQIEKARAPLTGRKLSRLGSPSSIATCWAVVSAIGIAVAMCQPFLLARFYDGEAAPPTEIENGARPAAVERD
jgi:predicted Ser/Thr protein kinase/MFS family permease